MWLWDTFSKCVNGTRSGCISGIGRPSRYIGQRPKIRIMFIRLVKFLTKVIKRDVVKESGRGIHIKILNKNKINKTRN